MSDHELLNLAAKAEGSVVVDNGEFWIETSKGWKYWMPLDDDGDALRLAVKLGISIDMEDQSAWLRNDNRLIEEYWGGDYDPCYLRAIVRAASEIGREMA